MLRTYIKSTLLESSWGSIREWYIHGDWIRVPDDSDHGTIAKQYIEQDKNNFDEHEDIDEYVHDLINHYDAIRRHGNTYLVKVLNKNNLSIIQQHIIDIQAELSTLLWIGILHPVSNVSCTVEELINADSIKDLDVAKGLYR